MVDAPSYSRSLWSLHSELRVGTRTTLVKCVITQIRGVKVWCMLDTWISGQQSGLISRFLLTLIGEIFEHLRPLAGNERTMPWIDWSMTKRWIVEIVVDLRLWWIRRHSWTLLLCLILSTGMISVLISHTRRSDSRCGHCIVYHHKVVIRAKRYIFWIMGHSLRSSIKSITATIADDLVSLFNKVTGLSHWGSLRTHYIRCLVRVHYIVNHL